MAVMDWFSRKVLAWRLSITMETDFCVEAFQEALDTYGTPEIFNTDQGVQFTAAAFIEMLSAQGVQISIDGKGRFLDNIFIERLWRSLKYEEVFTQPDQTLRTHSLRSSQDSDHTNRKSLLCKNLEATIGDRDPQTPGPLEKPHEGRIKRGFGNGGDLVRSQQGWQS